VSDIRVKFANDHRVSARRAVLRLAPILKASIAVPNDCKKL